MGLANSGTEPASTSSSVPAQAGLPAPPSLPAPPLLGGPVYATGPAVATRVAPPSACCESVTVYKNGSLGGEKAKDATKGARVSMVHSALGP